MGLFSLFSKASPEEIYSLIAEDISAAGQYFIEDIKKEREEREDDEVVEDIQGSRFVDAGAELVCLLVHLLDKQAFYQLGVHNRDMLIDAVSKRAIAAYCHEYFLSLDEAQNYGQLMLRKMNSRQDFYAEFPSLEGDGLIPGTHGSMCFAFGFFVHRALGLTDKSDVEFLLPGRGKLSESDMGDLPSPFLFFRWFDVVSNLLCRLNFSKRLGKL